MLAFWNKSKLTSRNYDYIKLKNYKLILWQSQLWSPNYDKKLEIMIKTSKCIKKKSNIMK